MDDADRAADYQARFNRAALARSRSGPPERAVCDECTLPTAAPVAVGRRVLCPECHGYEQE
jgi:hypothetical protein